MSKEKSKGWVIVGVHILAWALLGFVLMFYQPLSWGIKLPFVFWAKQLISIALLVGIFYFNMLYMVPSFLLKNNASAFALWIILSVVVMLVISKFVDQQLHVHEQMDALMTQAGPSRRPRGVIDGILLMILLLVLGVSTSLSVLQRWQKDAQIRESVEKQNIATELALLKAQINPHFFFNTLNNIYALTFTDVPVSRDAILKLSRMMRYLLYETQQDTSLLSQEISFIKDYMELMKLRLQSNTTVVFTESKPDREYSVAPMLLLPFIENAFKHGISAMHQASIRVDLDIADGFLTMVVKNHIFRDKDVLNVESGGIGLVNTQRRLDLLYPGKHELLIDDNINDNTYQVLLKINLV
ncbi:sensor histidine kinase [Dyadobacter sp. CY345]|uniref:sensor histidine kinase n=1 Tax=Dyadobacter sp. CY345 TaxID=2909335 RepID=UPI001F40F837|nr:histidine kinase [Dyadobacter sp. CY345]MCF2447720.1 sensor histidine kinase [Dyadobacter sp. CY345]